VFVYVPSVTVFEVWFYFEWIWHWVSLRQNDNAYFCFI